MWNVNSVIKAVEALLPELASKLIPGKDVYGTPAEKAFIDENFPACPNVSVDFGIMEKADNVYVSLGDFGWSDLGTWGSLYDLSPKDKEGNVTLKCESLMYNSKDNIVVLPQNKLAVIDGLEGYLIAESDNVLLICKKDEEHSIRKYVNDAQIKLGKITSNRISEFESIDFQTRIKETGTESISAPVLIIKGRSFIFRMQRESLRQLL